MGAAARGVDVRAPLRHPRLLWSAALLVGLAELAVAALALRPNVDARYRAYYIDHSSDCWPHQTDGRYALSTTLTFVRGPGIGYSRNKICGWFYTNARGTWSYGRLSLLRFVFPPVSAPLTLRVAAGAMVDKAHPLQHVVVSANGTALGTLMFDSLEPAERTLTIPAEVAASGEIDLRFEYPDARPGTELGPNEDPHLRALRMVSLRLG